MPRDSAKCRKWEQERRNRLKEKFNELAKALPSYDPSKPLCHVNILEEARKAIEELQGDIKNILTDKNKDKVGCVKDEIIKKLQKRIKKLLIRNEELHNLLKNGGNSNQKVFTRSRHIKISPELAKKLQQQEMEKENTNKLAQGKKKKIAANTTKIAAKHCSSRKNAKIGKSVIQNNKSSSNCLLFLPPGNTGSAVINNGLNQSFYLITNPASGMPVKSQKMGFQTSPIITRNVACINPPVPTLGPGTILFSNGNVLPVVPQQSIIVKPPKPITSLQKNSIGINLPTVTTPKIVTNSNISKMPNNSAKEIKKLPPILPLRKCSTNTTHVNKVPIPALSSSYTLSHTVVSNTPKKRRRSGRVQTVTARALRMINRTNASLKRKAKHDIENKLKKSKSAEDTTEKKQEAEEINEMLPNTVSSQVQCPVTDVLVIAPEDQSDCFKIVQEKSTLENVPTEEHTTDINDKSEKHTLVQEQFQDEDFESRAPTLPNTTNITQDDLKTLELNLSHSELSNEIFATLQVPSGCQNPESTSPTAAFLLTFPLVSSLKGTDEDNNESQSGPPGLLQVGSKTTQNSNVLNIDNFSFFSSKNICEGFYTSYDINTENIGSDGTNEITKTNSIEQNLSQSHDNVRTSQNKTEKDLIEKDNLSVNSKTSQKENNNSEVHYTNQESKETTKVIHTSNEDKQFNNSKQNMIILEQIIISKDSSSTLKVADENVEKEKLPHVDISDVLSNSNLTMKNTALSNQDVSNNAIQSTTKSSDTSAGDKVGSNICLNKAKSTDTVENIQSQNWEFNAEKELLNQTKKPEGMFWNLKPIETDTVKDKKVTQSVIKQEEAQIATLQSQSKIITENQPKGKCEVKQVADAWTSKSMQQLCLNTNQHIKSNSNYFMLTGNSNENQSLQPEKKPIKHFWNTASTAKLNDSNKHSTFQFDSNVCPTMWNAKTSDVQSGNLTQGTADIPQTQSKNIWNPKPVEKNNTYLETNLKNNYIELPVKQTEHSDNNNSLDTVSVEIKNQANKVQTQNNYVWNTDTIVPSNEIKKHSEPKQDNNSIWNPDLIPPTDLNNQQGSIQRKDTGATWNPELENTTNPPKMQTPNQSNAKLEKYLWPTKCTIAPDNVKNLPSNHCDKKQDINLWKNESSPINKDKIHTGNPWNLKPTVTDISKNQDTSQHDKRSNDFNKTQGSIHWNPEAPPTQYKSQVKMQDNTVLKSASLQSNVKQSNHTWNPESSTTFDPAKPEFNKKSNSNSWNPDLQMSGSVHNNSAVKKQGNHLWNPDSVVATDNVKKFLSLQLDKKQGSHLWNPESVMAEDVPILDKQCIWPSDSVPQNIHTCSRYNTLNVRQAIENVPNINLPAVHCSKHKDVLNTSNQSFQNVTNNAGNMWASPYYMNNNQMFTNVKIQDYDLCQSKEKQHSNIWTADANRSVSIEGKKHGIVPKTAPNVDNMKSNNVQYNAQEFGSNLNPLQTAVLWSTNTFEKQQTLIERPYKPQENSNNKQSDNNLSSQNEFALQYNLIPDPASQIINKTHNVEKKETSWNSHQHQEMAGVFDYNIQQEKSKSSKKNIIQSVENNKNIVSGKYNVHGYTQNNTDNIWSLHTKEIQSSYVGQEKNSQNNTDKPLSTNFSAKHNSKLADSNAQSGSKIPFEQTKPQDGTIGNSFPDKRINTSKAPFEFTQCNTNYNVFADKNKDTNKKTIGHQNMNQTKSETAKDSEQKSHYYFPTIYPAGDTSINFQNNDAIKSYCTTSYMNFNNNYPNPLYTNSVNYNYNATDTTFNQNYYKNKTDIKYPLNYDNFQDPLYSTSKYYHANSNCSRKTNGGKGKNSPQTKPVNWMTTPENKSQMVDCFLPTFSTQSYSFTSCGITTTEANVSNQVDVKKHINAEEKQQFSWSPSKYPNFVETSHNFVTPTLPTLVGDLALSNSNFGDQKSVKDAKKKPTSSDTQANFLSVSQLVDQTKCESASGKIVTRRSSGGRSKTGSSSKSKRSNKSDGNVEKVGQSKINSTNHSFEMMGNSTENFYEKNRNSVKNVSSSYSAEALIGNQVPSGTNKKVPDTTGKSQCTNLVAENIVTYFPTVDENYIISNQNFQNANFTHGSFQNTPYTTNNFMYTAPTMTSTYLPNTFEPTLPEYPTETLGIIQSVGKDKTPPNKNLKPRSKEEKANCPKKNKKKQTYEAGLNGLEYPFLLVPGSTNSPLLPDDFQAHTGLLSSAAPAYPCKNTVYQRPSADFNANPLLPLPGLPKNTIQQPEISPINSASTFTNFNLSSIFPEINKGAATTNIFQETGVKDSNSTALQVPFNIEPKYSFPQL